MLCKLMPFVLIGKFSHGKPILNDIRKAFTNFGLRGHYNLSMMDAKHLIIECDLEEDYTRLFIKERIQIQNFQMRLSKWTPDFFPGFESPIVPVWVTFSLLPLYFFKKEALFFVANLIGRPLRIDEPTIQRKRSGTARVCVEVDISKPLPEDVWLTIVDDVTGDELERIQQFVEFETVPDYCSHCCHLGHKLSYCVIRKNELLAKKESDGDMIPHADKGKAPIDPQQLAPRAQQPAQKRLNGKRVREFYVSKNASQEALEVPGSSKKVTDTFQNHHPSQMTNNDQAATGNELRVNAENILEGKSDNNSRTQTCLKDTVRLVEGLIEETNAAPLTTLKDSVTAVEGRNVEMNVDTLAIDFIQLQNNALPDATHEANEEISLKDSKIPAGQINNDSSEEDQDLAQLEGVISLSTPVREATGFSGSGIVSAEGLGTGRAAVNGKGVEPSRCAGGEGCFGSGKGSAAVGIFKSRSGEEQGAGSSCLGEVLGLAPENDPAKLGVGELTVYKPREDGPPFEDLVDVPTQIADPESNETTRLDVPSNRLLEILEILGTNIQGEQPLVNIRVEGPHFELDEELDNTDLPPEVPGVHSEGETKPRGRGRPKGSKNRPPHHKAVTIRQQGIRRARGCNSWFHDNDVWC